MKVYVDELPKSCNDCKFKVFIAYHQSGWEHSERYCSIMKDSYDCKCSKERCPLQSLADHDKQVCKEVCDEIKNRSAKSYSGYAFDLGKDVYSYTVCDFVLDQIEKGE